MELPVDILRPGEASRAMTRLYFNGVDPVLTFVHPRYVYVFIVGKGTLEAFDYDGKKVLESRLNVKWSNEPESVTDNQRMAFVHMGGEGNPHTSPAVSAAYLDHFNEVIVGHRDGSICTYSVRHGHMGVLTRSREVDQVVATSMVPLRDDTLLATGSDGSVQLINVAEGKMETIGRNKISHSNEHKAEATCVTVSDQSGNDISQVFVGYDNGCLTVTTIGEVRRGETPSCQFVAHAGPIIGVVSVFLGNFMVSVGADRAMAVFDTLTGRCLGRKVLGFDATVVYSPQMDPNNVHRAGQTTFVVGGKEGQIRIFSVELINPLIAKFSEIWKASTSSGSHLPFQTNPPVTSLSFCALDGVLAATSHHGYLHQWLLSADVARKLGHTALDAQHLRSAVADSALEHYKEPIAPVRIASMKAIIDSQEVLQAMLSPALGIAEGKKTELVDEFQTLQEAQQSRLEEVEKVTDLQRQSILMYYNLQAEGSEEQDGRLREAREISAEEAYLSLHLHHLDQIEKIALEFRQSIGQSMYAIIRKIQSDDQIVCEVKASVKAMR